MPGDDRLEVGAAREGAEGQAPLSAEARGAECVADRSRGVAGEQRSLQHQRHALSHPPSLGRVVLGGAQRAAQVGCGGVEAAVGALGKLQLGEERLRRLGLPGQGP